MKQKESAKWYSKGILENRSPNLFLGKIWKHPVSQQPLLRKPKIKSPETLIEFKGTSGTVSLIMWKEKSPGFDD